MVLLLWRNVVHIVCNRRRDRAFGGRMEIRAQRTGAHPV